VSRMLFRLERRVKVQVRRMRRNTPRQGLGNALPDRTAGRQAANRAGIAEGAGCSVSWVQRVLRRFRDAEMKANGMATYLMTIRGVMPTPQP
jgi:hypothetical protein